MPDNDLLARIAKALEEFNGVPRNTLNLGVAARTLLPEAAAALKIAVEALEKVRDMDNLWHAAETARHIARDALSRLTSAEECTCDPPFGVPYAGCPVHGQPSGEGK